MRHLIFMLLSLLLAGCGTRNNPAPVEELKWQTSRQYQVTHTVKRGETLYAVAFRYDRDYRELATYNHLNTSWLRVGQILRIPQFHAKRNPYRTPPHAPIPTRTVWRHPTVAHAPVPVTARTVTGVNGHWTWPAKGRIVANFYPQLGKKGIDIAGDKGAYVFAARNGIVAYAGSGLTGYGNLIIIKHDGQYLTAYGNNQRNRVKEGQKVKAGQIIADMGIIDRRFWGVHFEIRRAGQPVNPLGYLRTG